MHTTKTHPLTGLPILPVAFRKNGAPIWPILGGDDSVDPAGGSNPPADPPADPPAATEPKGNELPYPTGKAVADMTADEQVAYWKFHSQKHEQAWKGKLGEYTPEQVAEMAKRIEEIEAANLTETEKAVKEAYERGKAEAAADSANIAVRALIDARKANLDEKEDADVIESLDLLDYTKFITDGSVDSARLTKVLDRLAPVGGGTSAPAWPATGQGNRNTGTGSAKDAGKAEAERRFGAPAQ